MDPCLPDNLVYASYGGAGFWVETDEGKYGRRIVSHEYPMRDDPFHEDLGEAVNSWSVKAYVYGDDAAAQKDALIAACRQRGAQLLILPDETLMAVCLSISRSRSKDKQAWYEFTIEFRRDQGALAGPLSSIIFERQLADMAFSVASVFGDLFGEQMQTSDVLEYVPTNAIGRVQSFVTTLMQYVGQGPVGTATAASIIADIDGLSTSVSELIQPSPDQVAGVFCSDPRFVKPDVPYYTMDAAFRDSGAASALALTVGNLLGQVMDNMAPTDAITAAQTFTTFSVAEAPAVSTSASDVADATNATLFNSLVRVQGCIQWARAVAQAPYPTRAQAVNARATIVAVMDNQIDLLGTNGEAIQAVSDARDLCAQMLSSLIATIAPIITVFAPQSLPSLYWAARLYQDVGRAQELTDYNSVTNWGFMPLSFKAKAS